MDAPVSSTGQAYQFPVKDTVAIGVSDPVMGEEIKVYAVLKEGRNRVAGGNI
jgi:acyl-CoA synthetase (AMP-forming)/AMP-acid ligase II